MLKQSSLGESAHWALSFAAELRVEAHLPSAAYFEQKEDSFRFHSLLQNLREDEALHLAGSGDGDLIDELDAFGPQALGHVALFQVGDELVLGGRRCGIGGHDEGADALAEARVGHADGGGNSPTPARR